MKTFLFIAGFCIEVACFTTIINLYDWKAFALSIGAALGASIVAIMQKQQGDKNDTKKY